MGFREGGVKLTPPPRHILVFKYPSRDRVKVKLYQSKIDLRIRFFKEINSKK